VLEDGLDTFQANLHATTRAGQLLFFRVEQWFDSDDTAWPFSFANICDVLHVDATRLRAVLARWQAAGRPESSPRSMERWSCAG